jgi:hypothetical protein
LTELLEIEYNQSMTDTPFPPADPIWIEVCKDEWHAAQFKVYEACIAKRDGRGSNALIGIADHARLCALDNYRQALGVIPPSRIR